MNNIRTSTNINKVLNNANNSEDYILQLLHDNVVPTTFISANNYF